MNVECSPARHTVFATDQKLSLGLDAAGDGLPERGAARVSDESTGIGLRKVDGLGVLGRQLQRYADVGPGYRQV